MQTKSVVDKTCGHGALPVGGFMATPIGAHVLSFCQKYPSAGRTKKARGNGEILAPRALPVCPLPALPEKPGKGEKSNDTNGF